MAVARLVYAAEVIPDDDAAVARIHQPEFDPQTTAIVASEPACVLGSAAGEGGTAEIVTAEPGYWQIHTESPTPALLLLAETDYPGWQAAIDGEAVESLRAYTTLRAVCVPEGGHVVTWRYVPTIYMVGGLISLTTLILIGWALLKWRRAKTS